MKSLPIKPNSDVLCRACSTGRNGHQTCAANGTWVIGDRHDLSTQAYQGADVVLTNICWQHCVMLFSGISPRLNALSRCYPGSWLKTRGARGELDRIEQESFDFFNRTAPAIWNWQHKIKAFIPLMPPAAGGCDGCNPHYRDQLGEGVDA